MGTYGIVGNGRVARHVAHYLDLLGLPRLTWYRAAPSPAAVALASCDVVLVLISDAAIEPFIESHGDLRDKTLVHFSGSLVTPLARGMHPLSSFTIDLYDLDTYRAIPFVCDEGVPSFTDVFPDLPNPHYTIAAELKPLYHSMAVLAGNFTTMLWNKLFDTFEERFRMPREVSVPYLRQIAANLERAPATAQTGPLARRDRHTIRANLDALRADPYRDVYAAFVKAVAPELLEGSP